MAIRIEDQNLLFHLQTDHTSYIFQVMENGELGQVYYGKRVHSKSSYDNLTTREWHNASVALSLQQNDFQLQTIKQEYASLGKGDFRYPAYQVTQANGSRITEFKYESYELVDGKRRLAGLPSTFDDDNDDAQTLTISLRDKLLGLVLHLNYTIFPHQDVIIRSAEFQNQGNEKLTLNSAASAQLDLPDADYDFIQFSGAWSRERHMIRTHLRSGVQSISSLRGTSSHQQNPFMMLARPNTDDASGSVFGFNLVYSGNFADQIQVDQYDTSRVIVGINPAEFAWNLKPGDKFQTPEAVLSYTDAGMNQLSQQMGAFYQNHLVNQRFAHEERPTLINNWEATFMDFDENKLLDFAKTAKKLGLEMFVLDDGWFGHRNADNSSLGDWFVNQPKFPSGFDKFANQIHELGLKFGLWFEPEMISIDSELYKEHPDWLINAPGRHASPERRQFVLDMTRPEVVDYLFDAMSKIIDMTKLDYIKWDMNRNITETYSSKLSADDQLEMPHRYILGVYQLYDRLVKAYPDVLFESCSSGGGRFDLGMMYYAPQAWTSDDTDAVERMLIQFGTSYGYPQMMMGAHVSAVPNDQVGRITSLKTRANVAYFGDFGYELDITKMSSEEQQQVKEQTAFYNEHRKLFQFGKFYRIENPFKNGNVMSWEVVSDDKQHAIAARYQILNRPHTGYIRLYIKGLDPDTKYTVNGGSEQFYGDELMNAGLFVSDILHETHGTGQSADFNSKLFVIDAVK
ncbi:alpha-galactosidase [Lentilactobacillus otakiensis]|uniref:Alpha-galactosidase n=1 Tax=Lentilactobacillus otakiensis DSM 19908 = JCM 15040 TaxID=1423780 RepID=S4NQ35_9LACO|nr:alpha-galactosidase [Lentilactobacillus otakiensis]MBZ3777123.1 alpha-galactosidase [Lentilactobacillus otakiensis]MDV3518147.1 alpha-galactosidase [Lentilactobacillus otakiensis]GAD16118.1 alpha-galactosidase [Lentilactobacillus otakiensis DSM 19908 = JCM 15040]